MPVVDPDGASLRRRIGLVAALGFKASPGQMSLTLALTVIGGLTSLAYPVAFRVLIDGLVEGDGGKVTAGSVVVGVFFGLMWAAGILLAVEGVSLVDRVGFHLSCRFAALVNATRGIEHFERADYLAQLDLVRADRRTLSGGPRQSMLFLQVAIRSIGIVAILATIDVRLAMLAVFIVPAMVATRWSAALQQRADEASVDDLRLANDLFAISASPGPAKEVRTYGLAADLDQRHQAIARRVVARAASAGARSAAIGALGWAVHGVGFALVLALLVRLVRDGDASIGDLLLAVTLVRQVQQQVSRVSDIVGQLSASLRLAGRFLWLEDYGRSRAEPDAGKAAPPERLSRGITVENVSFRYPGGDAPVLEGIDFFVPAGSTVAVVGENGAGKTTLVKLLCGMYEPTEGRVLLDDVDLASMRSADLRERLSAAFQDHVAFELVARETVGIGDLARIGDEPVVLDAVQRAAAADVVDELPAGLETKLGRSFPDGTELSGGQWQKLAVARSMMRDEPLVTMLDEPTASLDPATEHALFTSYADQSQRARVAGGITVLVSHRFSTVRMADVIVVLDGGRLVEIGDHASLQAAGGLYATLYALQAKAYA